MTSKKVTHTVGKLIVSSSTLNHKTVLFCNLFSKTLRKTEPKWKILKNFWKFLRSWKSISRISPHFFSTQTNKGRFELYFCETGRFWGALGKNLQLRNFFSQFLKISLCIFFTITHELYEIWKCDAYRWKADKILVS